MRATAIPPKIRGRGGGVRVTATREKNPIVGPAPPPGRCQPIKTTIINEDKDDEIKEGDKSRDNKDNKGQRKSIFEGLKKEDFIKILIDIV